MIEQCANYKGSGHPASAPAETCYEANPKTPSTECPAPVIQNSPAVPGTVTVAKPEGERLVQRPQPLPEGKAGGKKARRSRKKLQKRRRAAKAAPPKPKPP